MASIYEKPTSPSQFAKAAETKIFKPGDKLLLERNNRLVEVTVVSDYKDILTVI